MCSNSLARFMGCCSCFGFTRKPKRRPRAIPYRNHNLSPKFLLDKEIDADGDDGGYNGYITDTAYEEEGELPNSVKRSEEILRFREQNGMICRQFPVKKTHQVVLSEDENGNKMVNEYVRKCKIGAGSYGKVVLYRSSKDGKHYAIKAFHKSHLMKVRIAPSETAMTDVLREVVIMNMLQHPNIINLIEVIDDPNTDNFYMAWIMFFIKSCQQISFTDGKDLFLPPVLEYVDGKWAWEGSGPPGRIGENTARRYMRDIVSGLMYLHDHNMVHLDIKPDNLLVTHTGVVKIGDFSVSQVFEDDNDELHRSPGTPVFTAPECCLGLSYHGRAADMWALGVTLYRMILGQYPFLGESLPDQYDKIVNNPLALPDEMNPQLRELLEGLLCKDPTRRMTLDDVAKHTWIVAEDGPILQHICWCKRKRQQREQEDGNQNNTHITLLESNGIKDDIHVTVTD